MEEILGRLRSYETSDSLEAMRNEYVVALLHASIMDITRSSVWIVGEESRGRVDYAIKVKILCYSSSTPAIMLTYH
jgi:hypothetical protein